MTRGVCCVALLLLGGCGLKGELYLPEPQENGSAAAPAAAEAPEQEEAPPRGPGADR